MPDMLVKLYQLPDLVPYLNKMKEQQIVIRPALSPEKHIVVEWVKTHFSQAWSSEVDVAFANSPVSCIVAVNKDNQLIGFGCYDATCRDYFGPTGVDKAYRGKGVGSALFIYCLHALRQKGYAYAIIGAAGPMDFYRQKVGATVIEDSRPGIYKGLLKE